MLLCAPSSSQTCKVLDCAVAPVVHIIMENRSKAPKAIRMAPEGAPNPQGLALYVITEEIIVSLPALTHRQRGMIKSRGGLSQDVDWTPKQLLRPGSGASAGGSGNRREEEKESGKTSASHSTPHHTHTHTHSMHTLPPPLPAHRVLLKIHNYCQTWTLSSITFSSPLHHILLCPSRKKIKGMFSYVRERERRSLFWLHSCNQRTEHAGIAHHPGSALLFFTFLLKNFLLFFFFYILFKNCSVCPPLHIVFSC